MRRQFRAGDSGVLTPASLSPARPEEIFQGKAAFAVIEWISVFVAGAAVMAIEILGTRVLGSFFGVTLYVWGALITVTLAALAAGYLVGGRLGDHSPQPGHLFAGLGLTAVLIAIAPLARRPVLLGLIDWDLRAGALMSAMVLFFSPLVLLGAVSPFVVRLRANRGVPVGRAVGGVFALSTTGGIFGALLTPFLLIPFVGVGPSLCGCAALLTFPGLIAFTLGRRWIALTPQLLLLIFCVVRLRGDTSRSSDRASHSFDPRPMSVLFARDGLYGRVRVADVQNLRLLSVDTFGQSVVDTADAEPKYDYVRAFNGTRPLFSSERPRALMIGGGAGGISRLLERQGVTTDVVELDPLIVDAARRFFDFAPTGDVFVMDGRTYLRRSERRYDAVVLDAYNGGGAVPAHLLSIECFREAKRILTPEGFLALSYTAVPESRTEVVSVAKTLSAAFRDVRAFEIEPGRVLSLLFFAADRDLPWDSVTSPWLVESHRLRWTAAEIEEVAVLRDDLNPAELLQIRKAERFREELLTGLGPSVLLE